MSMTLSILVADDDAVSRMVLASMLRRAGHAVETAIDGLEAVEAAARCSFDVIFMDLQMPVLDGIEAARRIRTTRLDQSIIALTATLDDETTQRCRNAGVELIAQKPLSPDDIAVLLASVMSATNTSSLTSVVRETTADTDHVIATDRFDRFRQDVASHSARKLELVISDVIGGLRGQVTMLIAAADAGDTTSLCRSAHSIRGGAATLGAARLASRAAAIELESTNWTQESCRTEAAAVASELDAAEREIVRLLAEGGAGALGEE